MPIIKITVQKDSSAAFVVTAKIYHQQVVFGDVRMRKQTFPINLQKLNGSRPVTDEASISIGDIQVCFIDIRGPTKIAKQLNSI